jgi:hypothetical protein
MTKGLRILLGLFGTGVLIGFAMLLGTAANAAEGATPDPQSTTSVTQKSNGDTITNTTATATKTEPSDWFAPGGIFTISIGGVFLVVREIKSMRQQDIQGYKERAETAENKATIETGKLAAQIERLEKKLDDALKDVESKHDEWIAEVQHRRKLEILLAEHGIAVPTAAAVTVTVEDKTSH